MDGVNNLAFLKKSLSLMSKDVKLGTMSELTVLLRRVYPQGITDNCVKIPILQSED